MPAADKEEAYRQLSSYLPFDIGRKEFRRDFNYQINRPRKSRVFGEDLRINRLMKWNFSFIWFRTIAGISLAKNQWSTTPQSSHMCFLELDINTDAEIDEPFVRERPSLNPLSWYSSNLRMKLLR